MLTCHVDSVQDGSRERPDPAGREEQDAEGVALDCSAPKDKDPKLIKDLKAFLSETPRAKQVRESL